ncbi:uncharacterized protein LACBIDRAFT_309848 [Laccaria bicolor S238N-H82]|uniref:Predicted protein n=1 Tax=Laccaria bicolor (strain S238N-H82 / ATCC MYA-4686) TaxID=486041 RepID=B0DT67_LACBS|nr:uncharacterized protein LACBIDRAFT_309848 [Laccaria bicolor S238N-H82]EDR02224.1 predicted protein [Laccaria bicolor S238N-H82]|eukprot:XP_001887169.1 predicted protein [Laccaria bicolor S238N-H82]
MGDDGAEGVHIEEVDEFDEVFGNGADFMDIHLPGDPALSARETVLLKKLDEKLNAITFQLCDCCLEEGFDLNVVDGTCSRCRNNKGDPVKKWSSENKVNPALEVPLCLRGLTDMEDMVIARVKSYMQDRWTKG